MLLLLSAFNNFNTPVERTLLGLCNVQKETKTTVSVVAACMLHELLLAENLYNPVGAVLKRIDTRLSFCFCGCHLAEAVLAFLQAG